MTASPLAGFGVLVTNRRPDTLVTAIEQAGGLAVSFPVIEIQGRDTGAVLREQASLPDADIAIFVSPNAVEFGLAAVPAYVRVAAIGPATRAAIEAAGRQADICSDSGFDSEHLLAEAGLLEVAGATIRIVRADSGRELLAKTLRARGARVDYLSVYRRLPARPSAGTLAETERTWRAGQIDCVTVMSVESLQCLCSILPYFCRNGLPAVPLVTPSKRVIQTATEMNPAARAILAPGPLAADLLRALIGCRRMRPENRNEPAHRR